jgi:hypothetical protein
MTIIAVHIQKLGMLSRLYSFMVYLIMLSAIYTREFQMVR